MGDKKYYFQKLTPVSNADISVYEEAIDFVFDNSDVKNIAISGAYSAGKSSILESYKKKHKDIRCVQLSLAHFRTPEQENDESEEKVKESVLEGKILNQLIHQIPAERIHRKIKFSPRNIYSLSPYLRFPSENSLFLSRILYNPQYLS